MSDTDLSGVRMRKSPRRGSAEATLAGITSRIGSRFPSLSRWGGPKKGGPTPFSIYELSADSATRIAGAISSRSSSISSPYPFGPDYTPEAALSPSPSQSCWGSVESVVLPNLDIEKTNNSGRNLERERALATTPLLPPLITDNVPQPPPRRPQTPSRARSASVFEHPTHVPVAARTATTTPALSTKPSLSSFKASPTSPELPIPFPNLLNDEWSDRLGHANFTILPLPYLPEIADLESLRKLREDWDLARTNYTKHLFRTGENYGQTSKIYGLTEEKWAEVEQSWKRMHDKAVEQILAATSATSQSMAKARSRSRGRGRGRAESTPPKTVMNDIYAGMEWKRIEDTKPGAIPRMLSEDKFPSRGDEDIVGPMVRDEPMARGVSVDGRGVRLWKNIVDKVGLRR